MSSFICDPKHFNSIEKTVQYLALGSEFHFPYALKNIYPELYNKSTGVDIQADKVSEIVDTLRSLNVLCVSLQYKHNFTGVLDAEIAEQMEIVQDKPEGVQLSTIGLYKAIQCVNYQIETEHLKELRELTEDEQNAMIFLKAMDNHLAYLIVMALPEYDTAKWEIM